MLFPGDFLSTGWEVFGFRHVSLLPVVFERRVIWCRRSLDQDVSFNGKPSVFEQVLTGLLVTKHPVVLPVQIKPSPIFALLPFLGFMGVGSLDMSYLFVKHPIIKLVKRLFGSSCAVIVCPTANNGVQSPQDFPDAPPPYCFPLLLHLLPVFLNSLFAWLGQQLPSRFRVGGFVVPDVETQEIKPFRQVNNLGLLR